MKPYFYKIRDKLTGKFYVGCQYGVKSDPSNFWITYFTSNNYIKSSPKSNFDIIAVVQRNDARIFEKRYLQKCYRLLGREKFLSTFINRNIAPGILNTPETIAKANSDKKRLKNSLAAKKRIAEGSHNFITNPYIPTENQRKLISIRMKGNNYGSLRKLDENYRRNAAELSKGNTNVRGKHWWNNGKQRKRSILSPGEEWVKGFTIKQNNEEFEIN